MADENVLAPAPIRSDDQILPFAAWAKTGAYSFQLVETKFVLDANLLRDALKITPIDQAYHFVLPSLGDAIIDFVNQLGYIEIIHFVSRMAVNNLYQPWRAILSMINQCLTGKTSGHDRPRYPVLQMLWGIITSTNFDYAELLWEEFVQAIQTFLTDKANLGSPTKKVKKDKPHVIPYYSKLGNLKFVPKGEIDEVFGMPIPDELISNNIRNAPYYNAYLEMVAKHDRKMSAEKEGKKKTVSAKQPKLKPAVEKASKPASKPKASKVRPSMALADKPPKPKPAKEKSTKTTLPQPTGKGKVVKVHKVKSPFHLVDEPNEEPTHSEPELKLVHKGKCDEDDMEHVIRMKATRPLPVVEGKGKAIATEEQAAHSLLALYTPKRRSTIDQFILQRQTLVTKEASTGPYAQAQDDTSVNIVRNSPSPADAETETRVASEKTNSRDETKILHIDEEQGKDVDDQVNLDEKIDELDQGQAGSSPESRGALARPDPKPTHDEFIVDPYPKVQESLKFLADEHVMLEEPLSSSRTLSLMKNLDDAYTIGDQFINDKSTKDEPDLPHKINEAVRESMKEAVHIDLQASLRDCFRELPEANMKEILHQWMFESGSYKSLPEHVALYEALEASMKRAQRDEFIAKKDKSRKRRPPHSSAWKNSNTRDAPLSYSKQQSDPHAEQLVEDIPMPDTAIISDSDDTDSAHLPKIKKRPKWLKPIPDNERAATPKLARVIPSPYILDAENNWANALATTYQAPTENSLLEKTGDMQTIMHCKGSRQALSISKMKAARYLDFGLELIIPEHIWINEVCTYDISASYGISHWLFNRQKFYIDRHITDSSRKVVRTHMRILSVVSIKSFSHYGDFEEMNLLLLQGHLNHLFGSDKHMISTAVKLWTRNLMIRQRVEDFQLDIECYQKQLNLTKLGRHVKGFEYKNDYIIINSPHVVVFPVGNNKRKIMRFNVIYKFSDGTLTNIMDTLDFRVKEYKVNQFNSDSRPEGSSKIWNALLVVAYEILTTDCFREPNEHFISAFSV
nr:monodehydroascorbate reductase [Tanacetum cinerariifolium]